MRRALTAHSGHDSHDGLARRRAPEKALRSPLVLASASPRRQEILRWAGLPFEVWPSRDEPDAPPGQDPVRYCRETARRKAVIVARRFPERLVVGADTVVALGNTILGKPADPRQAQAMLRALSGRQHVVYTGLAIVAGPGTECLALEHEETRVTFAPLSATEIERYVATGDPLDKAGAYGIQSQGGELVVEVLGSYLNVVGLPLARLQAMLARLGWTMWENNENEATGWRRW